MVAVTIQELGQNWNLLNFKAEQKASAKLGF